MKAQERNGFMVLSKHRFKVGHAGDPADAG
jgi:hypothetical protein